MTARDYVNALREQIGLAPLLFSIISLPLVSYITYHVALGVPLELASAQGLARYSFFLVGSFLATFALARILDFLMTGLFIIAVECLVFIRCAIKIWRRKPSDMAIARYELKVIIATDKFSQSKFSVQAHMLTSLVFAVLFYWIVFLDGTTLIYYLGLIILIFLLASSGFTRRMEMKENISAKRNLLKLVAVAKKEVDTLDAQVDEYRKLVGESAEDSGDRLNTAVSHSAKARDLFERVSRRESAVRLFDVSIKRNLISLYSRVRPSRASAIANPVGIVAVAFAAVIFIAIARADGILKSRPWLSEYGEKVVCARVLAITDSGFYLQIADGSNTHVFVLNEQFKSVTQSPDSCEQET